MLELLVRFPRQKPTTVRAIGTFPTPKTDQCQSYWYVSRIRYVPLLELLVRFPRQIRTNAGTPGPYRPTQTDQKELS